MLDAKKICELLGVNEKTLRSWVKEGMPVAQSRPKRLFVEDEVVAWLEQQGYAEPAAPPETVAHTQAEAADLLGVSVRTLAAWSKRPGFPGKQGRPGQQTGHFPIEKIRAWHAELTGGDDTAESGPKYDYLQAKAILAQLEASERLGNVAEVEPLLRLLERQIAVATAYLEDLPDLIIARLPANVKRDTRKRIRQAAVEAIERSQAAIAEALQGDTDEAEEREDAS